jgi:outer membrane protein
LNIIQTIKSTVENNPKIKIGLEKLQESRELIIKASGELLPEVTGKITGTYETNQKISTTSTTEDDTFGDTYKLTVSQNLYDAGYNQHEIDRSKILFDNEIINFKIIIEELILNAITGYLTVINYEKSLKANEKNFEAILKAFEETKTKYNSGSATLYDLHAAESLFAIAKVNLFSANQNLIISKKSFKRIVGLEAINIEDVVKIDSKLDLNIIEKNAIINNLSLLLIKNDIKNKKILLLKEEKSKKPNLDLAGTAEYSEADRIDDGTETTKGTISLTLTIPIFQQGIDNSNIRKYHSQILQTEFKLEDSKDELLLSISNRYKDYLINELKMRANKTTIKASETALLSLQQEFIIGTKTVSDLVEEEEKLLAAKVNYFNAKKDYLISYFNIKSLEGTLLDSFKEYLPELN